MLYVQTQACIHTKLRGKRRQLCPLRTLHTAFVAFIISFYAFSFFVGLFLVLFIVHITRIALWPSFRNILTHVPCIQNETENYHRHPRKISRASPCIFDTSDMVLEALVEAAAIEYLKKNLQNIIVCSCAFKIELIASWPLVFQCLFCFPVGADSINSTDIE